MSEIESNVKKCEECKKCTKANKLQIRYHKEIFPELKEIEIIENGDFLDLRSAENVVLNKGDFGLINLGISIKVPDGFWAQIVPRSSTFKNFGIIQTNSFGVIDESYCGDGDILKMPVYAIRDTIININDRICQLRIVPKNPIDIETVDKLDGPDRGGFGSTGIK